MTISTTKEFIPGTLGWTAAHLDDLLIEAQWKRGRYEIVEGVLTIMPAAYFDGGETLVRLLFVLQQHIKAIGIVNRFSVGVDIILTPDRVARADGAMLTAEDSKRQRMVAKQQRRKDLRRTRVLVPPTLVIEVSSPGHESHDESTKRRWYAEAGVPHYWIFDCFRRVATLLRLNNGAYDVEQAAEGDGELASTLFPGLTIKLAEVWPMSESEDEDV